MSGIGRTQLRTFPGTAVTGSRPTPVDFRSDALIATTIKSHGTASVSRLNLVLLQSWPRGSDRQMHPLPEECGGAQLGPHLLGLGVSGFDAAKAWHVADADMHPCNSAYGKLENDFLVKVGLCSIRIISCPRVSLKGRCAR
jgi:hypothetical protein